MRCDVCGRYIPLKDLVSGLASRELLTPSSEYTKETFETLCKTHKEDNYEQS